MLWTKPDAFSQRFNTQCRALGAHGTPWDHMVRVSRPGTRFERAVLHFSRVFEASVDPVSSVSLTSGPPQTPLKPGVNIVDPGPTSCGARISRVSRPRESSSSSGGQPQTPPKGGGTMNDPAPTPRETSKFALICTDPWDGLGGRPGPFVEPGVT